MLQIKIFVGTCCKELENVVNDWLEKNEINRIEHVTQSESRSDDEYADCITYTIVYDTQKQGGHHD